MKGISHFMMGIAATSFLPAAVESSFHGSPLLFVLGGVAGLAPDTIDFKFAKFFAKHEIELTPDPLKPDAQLIADALAFAVQDANNKRMPIRIKLNTIQLHANKWLRYTVDFIASVSDRGNNIEWGVKVEIGDIVNTGGEIVESSDISENRTGYASLKCDIKIEYSAQIIVDILDGPTIGMIPNCEGRVTPRLIPWHRRFSHSIVACILASLGVSAVINLLAGLIVLLAFGLHIAADQLGHMGSSLWYPFTMKRARGLGLMQSGDSLANFAAVWLSGVCVVWNLLRYSPGAATVDVSIGGLIMAAIVPISLVVVLRRLFNDYTLRIGANASTTN
ncbi:MAG: metal-dependent hydrolase [Lentisphaerae bacterium]|nr:metal-dependent hydrolase [Lentisphaerota bacterium]